MTLESPLPNGRSLTVVVLAAGGGTRMKSKTMKVLHPVCGRSMIAHVITAVREMAPHHVIAVVGNQREQVSPHILEMAPETLLAEQASQRGTGDAVRVAMETAPDRVGTVVVAAGDTPLLDGQSLRDFVAEHEAGERAVSILSGVVSNPHGYGRIIRNDEGDVEAIVEQKDATPDEVEINEINSGILAFDTEFLLEALPQLSNDNQQGEYYLTDVVAIAREMGLTVGAHVVDDVEQTEGVNDRTQLAKASRAMNQRILRRWMAEGVTVIDPETTWVDADVTLGPDVTLLPGTQLLGVTAVAEDAVVGPDVTLKDCEVGQGAKVVRSHAELAVIGAGANVGPYSFLRPGTKLGKDAKMGAFVESKNASIGDGSKVPHLSYVGDADIGPGANIGAGTIFANYDGLNKHRTTVGAGAKTGSNNTFVAPVNIGAGAGTGAGTTVREDVPAGALAVSSGPQRNLLGWTLSRRPGTPQADAAEAAGAQPADRDS